MEPLDRALARIIREDFVGRDALRRFGVSRRWALHKTRRDTYTTGNAPYNSSSVLHDRIMTSIILKRWLAFRA